VREKTLKKVITFNSTTDVIAFEKYCHSNGVPGRIIPVPRQISASCGLCWMLPIEDADSIEERIREAGLSYAATYELMI